jgi:hypothetical protein
MDTSARENDDPNISLEQWREFLATPPSWEPHGTESMKVSQFCNWLPATLFDDNSPTRDSGSDSDDTLPASFACPPEEFDSAKDGATRSIQLTNLDPYTTTKELMDYLKVYGEVESMDLSNIGFGIAIVRFYDIRSAQSLRWSCICLRNRCIGVAYGPPLQITNPRKPPNNGTIVVFHLRKGVLDEDVHNEFSQFGAIRQIRCAPGKLTQRFIEFYDLRAAQAAVKGMKGKKVFKSKISVEYSLPGGFKKFQEQLSSPRLPKIERAARSHTPWAISY